MLRFVVYQDQDFTSAMIPVADSAHASQILLEHVGPDATGFFIELEHDNPHSGWRWAEHIHAAQEPDDDPENHEHQWGPIEHSRLAGTVHRKCQVVGCKVINAYDDDPEEGDDD
jgi:hypothetical protein